MKILSQPALAAVLLTTLAGANAQADIYTLTSGGLTNIVSTTFGADAITVIPSPTGFDSGTLNIDINSGTGDVTFMSGAVLELSNFSVEIDAGIFGTSTADLNDTTLTFNTGATSNLGGGLSVQLSASANTPVVNTNATFSNCSGSVCILLPLLSLDLVSYEIDITFSADYSTFSGTFSGVTNNNSTMSGEVSGMVQ